MSLRGSLADLPLPDLLQIVSSNRKTGRMRVTTAEGEGLFVFRDGKIIYGATNAHREGFGSALVLRGLITPEQLEEALELKARAVEDRRLGFILMQMGAVTEEQLGDVLRGQLHEVTKEMFRWRQGVVEFEEVQIAPQGEVAVDAHEFLMREGESASGVMLAVVNLSQSEPLTPNEELLAALDWRVGERPHGESEPPPKKAESLGDIIREFRSPLWAGESALSILRAGAEVVGRGVLLLRAADGFRGIGQFGVWSNDQADRVRSLRIALHGDSLLGKVAKSRRPFRGAPDPRPHNLMFFRFLECDPPHEVVVLPVVVGDEVQLLFYGDNLPAGDPIGDTSRFESFLAEVGQAMESAG